MSENGEIDSVKAMRTKVGRMFEEFKQNPGFDQRWIAIAETDLETGFMTLLRALYNSDK